MSIATNSLNINSSGVVAYNATTGVFSESVLTQHDILIGGASNAITSVAPGTAGFVLTSNGAAADPSMQAVSASGAITSITTDSGSVTPTAGVVTISGGTAGLTTTAFSAHVLDLTGTLNAGHGGSGLATYTTFEILASGTTATGNYQEIPNSTSGYVLYSNGAGVLPSFKASTAVSWIDVTTGAQTANGGFGYITDNATIVTYTLPVSPTFGDVFKITGGLAASATSPWILLTNATQTINFGNTTATTSVASTLQYDSIECVCIADGVTVGASVAYNIIDSVGNLILT